MFFGLFGGKKQNNTANSRLDIRLPSGGRVQQTFDNGLNVHSTLSKFDQTQLNRSRSNLGQLASQLYKPSAQEAQRIQSYQNLFFDKLRKAINDSADTNYAQTESDLAQRFGGSANSTFGNDLLSRIEKNRLNSIADAQSNATLYGQQLADDAEQSRIRKIQTLQGYIGELQSPTYSLLPLALQYGEKAQANAPPKQSTLDKVASGLSDGAKIASAIAQVASL